MKNLLTIVGERIRYLRKNRGLTQEQLGELVGLPQSYMGGIERGEKNISLETLERIVNALNVKPEEVIFRTNDKADFEKDKLIDIISVLLKGRELDEVEIVEKLVKDVLKAFDERDKRSPME
ncbi:helix-turn-helix domain-containing protein [Paenibacillus vini]|uniref:Transcriptional regulator n=1 Tax=Paenibacillus vini TaxID=1476024 RepID=A0ABQ4MH58_9BACL|nr:helix-turn-helix transcriptional regulator [Paenibacillus vini]GIP55311.1 transcriptional regulator [Paenibacillus vini]